MKNMNLNLLLISILVLLFGTSKLKAQEITVVNFAELKAEKQQILDVKERIFQFELFIKKADSLLERNAFSVMHKIGIPPSGDKHDYMTIGPYWWPNPDTENGLPYIRKDGEINPEARNNFTDYVELNSFFGAVKTLKEAYFITDDKKYAEKAVEFIDIWFLDKATKMNPNIDFGQSIPGINDGRKFGIIEFEGVVEVIECLEVLESKNLLNAEIQSGMNAWFTDYSLWLQTSEHGIGEANTTNNHGTHYDIQLVSLLIYLERYEEAKEHLLNYSKARIFNQIEPNGSQPRELARTKSFSYSVMNLHGFIELSRLGNKIGVDLWSVESEDGRSIKKGFQYMLPYLLNKEIWEYLQIKDAQSSVDKLLRDMKFTQQVFNETAFDGVLNFANDNEIFIRFKK